MHSRLKGEKIRKVLKVLDLTKSTYCPAFNRLCKEVAAACDEESSSEYFGREPQVGLCVGLRHTKSGRLLVAITCHLSSHFQEPWRQVAQSHAVVAAGCALAEKMGEGTAVVMGADLNSIPGSGVYQLITHATLAASHPHMQHCGRADDVSMPSFGKLGGSLNLNKLVSSSFFFGKLVLGSFSLGKLSSRFGGGSFGKLGGSLNLGTLVRISFILGELVSSSFNLSKLSSL